MQAVIGQCSDVSYLYRPL